MILAGNMMFPQYAEAQYSAVRTNVIGLATGTVNVGFDVSVTDKWTLDVSGLWNPIDTDSFSCQFLGVQLGAKRWLYESFVGHFIGGQITYGSYLYGGSRRYYKGSMTGVGFSYGYSWLLSKRWNISAEIGVGIFRMKDTRRDRKLPEYEPVYVHHFKRWAIGPSRAEISFSYLF